MKTKKMLLAIKLRLLEKKLLKHYSRDWVNRYAYYFMFIPEYKLISPRKDLVEFEKCCKEFLTYCTDVEIEELKFRYGDFYE